ncbi:S1 RNA-binding domain-containing protein [Candidatus Endomicrobiellum devescovinae]|jgi:small subunit ribosomal protein S1|uniref:S1 RNA-binding domain-containing protein n=1 Tax=Candidatus Endomicrobiellum devescovinae TaxID=3242322 RepID=UPI00281D61DC|nr:S1 RNA-binding domain-containing protein [Endomicrobium sp.]
MAENKNLDKTIFEDSEDVCMADLMKSYDKAGKVEFGQELDVVIMGETADGFMVDLGIKSEGIIPKKEFEDGKIPSELKVGAKVKVKVINTQNLPILSYKAIVEKAKIYELQNAFNSGSHVTGIILRAIKGGFIVDIGGINAFLPISQLDIHFVKDTQHYIGKTYEFVITEFDVRKKNIVVSRRKIVEDEKNASRESALASATEGQVLDGIVSRITNFGAFVDIGGIDGLLHIGELAWYKVKKVEDLLHVGQRIKVQVIKVDKAGGKISLSIKSLIANPWDSVAERFPVGLVIKGKVTSIMDYGVFVELEPGIEGLLHASEYAWNDSEAALKREVKKGQDIEVKIIDVDKENKKIALSVKQTLSNPWDEAFRHYAPGSVVKGTVQNLVPFGAFVKLPEGIEGLVHISDFSWTKKINHPENVLKKGDEVEVVVMEVNLQNEKISLSLKHVTQDPYKKYKAGNIVKGKVVRITDFGAFVELEPGIEASIKNSEVPSLKFEKPQVFADGEELEVKIIKIDSGKRRIEVSAKALEFDREKELVKQFANQDDKPTLGELLSEEE